MTIFYETPRLIARRFRKADIDAFAAYRGDKEVARYQSWDSYTRKDAADFMDWVAARNPGDKGWFQFALERRHDGVLAGDCGLKIEDHDTRLGQVGYTIARGFWSQGYASEALSGLIGYAFAKLSLHRIAASIDPRNLASVRVLEKCGFRKEAHFYQSEWFKGEWADDVIYALLRNEWS